MLFKAIGPDGKTMMSTEYPSCVYDSETLLGMEKNANYRFTVNGKPVKASKVHDVLAGEPEPPPVKETKVSGVETGRFQASKPNISATPKSIEHKPDSQVAADMPPYNVIWSVCKKSKSYDNVTKKSKTVDILNDAKSLLDDKAKSAGLSYWAGGYVEDASGVIVYCKEV